MKKNKITSLLTLCIFSLSILAQNPNSGFEDGYIIDQKGDTLKGFVKVSKKDEDNYAKVTFKKTEADKKSYTPSKIKGYGIGETHYASCKLDGSPVFVKRLSTGSINLYEIKVLVFLMGKEKLTSDYYYQKAGTEEYIKLKSGKNLKKQLSEIMADNAEIVSDLENKKIEPENAVEIFDQYNSSK